MIALVTTASDSILGGDGPLVYNITPSGANTILLVGIFTYQADASDPTAVTFNGNAMTQMLKVVNTTTAVRYYVYGILNPTSGAHAISISFNNGNNTYIRSTAAVYSDVNQSLTPDASATNSYQGGAAASLSQAITTVADNCWIVGLGASNTFSSFTNLTQEVLKDNAAWGDYGPQTPAGSRTITVNSSPNSTQMGLLLLSLKPFVAGGGGGAWFNFL